MEVITIILAILIGLFFSIFEGILYYDPFKRKFWSLSFFTREKKTFMEKMFPIDGGHIMKQLLVISISFALAFDEDKSLLYTAIGSLVYYCIISIIFNIGLNYLQKLSNKKNNGK